MPWEKFGEILYDFEEDVFERRRLKGKLHTRKTYNISTESLNPFEELIEVEKNGFDVFDRNSSVFNVEL